MKLYTVSDTHPALRNSFISVGYRKSYCTFKECLQYLCVLHNEWGDFWSHFLTLVGFLVWITYLFTTGVVTTEPYHYPLVCYFIGSCICMLGSSTAHCFSPMSADAHTILFMFDYLSISSYAFGADLALYYYERPVHHWFFNLRWVNIGMFLILCVTSTVVSSFSRFYCKKYRYIIRAIVYSLPALVGTAPMITRFFTSEDGDKFSLATIPLHIMCYVGSVGAFFFFASKLPERVSPWGKFNYFGHSHQIFHIFVSISITAQMASLIIDSNTRRNVLTGPLNSVTIDFASTFIPFIFVNVFNLVTILVFSFLIVKGYLVDEKTLESKNK